MPKKEYGWDKGNVPIIGEHSLAKHRILREYVQRYIEILTANPRIERLKLSLVDGFAGGGIYQKKGTQVPHFGSPAILIEATAAAQSRVNKTRVKPVTIQPKYYFVDKNSANVSALQDTLAKYVQPQHPGVEPTILTGAFEDHLEKLVEAIKQDGQAHRAIFVLDQYGYTAVPLASLQQIFRELPKAEVFLTLAVGWIASYLRNTASAGSVVRKSLGLREETPEDEIADNLLCGADSATKLRVVQQVLHDAFVQKSGAAFATPFFIVSRESNRPYWFLHLANSQRANDVVKQLHWELQNHFSHFGDTGLSMLGFDPFREPDPRQQLLFAFDSIAKQQTELALMAQLPDRLRRNYYDGIQFNDLFAALTNETPATKDMLRTALTSLCREGDFTRLGGCGEHRHCTTPIRDSDVVMPSRQLRLVL